MVLVGSVFSVVDVIFDAFNVFAISVEKGTLKFHIVLTLRELCDVEGRIKIFCALSDLKKDRRRGAVEPCGVRRLGT